MRYVSQQYQQLDFNLILYLRLSLPDNGNTSRNGTLSDKFTLRIYKTHFTDDDGFCCLKSCTLKVLTSTSSDGLHAQ